MNVNDLEQTNIISTMPNPGYLFLLHCFCESARLIEM